MAKKIEANIAVINVETIKVLPSTALSIVSVGDRIYSVVSVKFNLDTKEAGEIEVLHSDLDIYEAQYQFKMETVKLGLF
jgi:hypothetical protein